MIYLLDRTQIISHSVNKSERHPALSEIAKFISLSIVGIDSRYKLFWYGNDKGTGGVGFLLAEEW